MSAIARSRAPPSTTSRGPDVPVPNPSPSQDRPPRRRPCSPPSPAARSAPTPTRPPAARARTPADAEAAPAPAPGSPFWVDPESDAARQIRLYQGQGRTADAQALRRIADRPVATWPSGDNPQPGIRRAVEGAAKDKRTALFVAYNIPHRDCGKYSAGGANGVDGYRAWYGMFAEAIGDAPAVVILEPDAVAHMVDGCTTPEHHAERYQLLNEAIGTFKKLPRTKVYLDAGNPSWLPDPDSLVEPLRRAGHRERRRVRAERLQLPDRRGGKGVRGEGVPGARRQALRHGHQPQRRGPPARRPRPGLVQSARAGPWATPPIGQHRGSARRRVPVDQAAGRLGRALPGRPVRRDLVAGVRPRAGQARPVLTPPGPLSPPGATSPRTGCPPGRSRRPCTSRAGPAPGPSGR